MKVEDVARQAPDLVHIYCCDEGLALCGLDLTGVPLGTPEQPVHGLCFAKAVRPCGARFCRLRSWWRGRRRFR